MIIDILVPQIIVSYDIACQWGIHFHHRVKEGPMPGHLHPPPSLQMTTLVPKFHLEAHTTKCHARYSFNYAIGVGRTDGEGVERNWSLLNGIASSVSMMGPGACWDTLDDFCNFANWCKTVDLCL
jgi:Kyakuja-Dileera-Zisupton transposase